MPLDSLTNETNIITRIEEELPKSTLYWFFISLAATIFWAIYLTYYNSRVIGLIVTFIANKFVKYGRVNVGKIGLIVTFIANKFVKYGRVNVGKILHVY